MWTEISNSLLCQQTTKKVFSLHAVLLNYLYIWLEYFQMKGSRGKKKKKKIPILPIHNVVFDELYTNLIFALQVATRCQ